MSRLFTFLGFVLFIQVPIFAQFDGIVGSEGCKAIEYKDSRFIDWAKTCVVTRGKVDIAKPEKGLVSFGKEENAIGAVSSTDVYDCISLGDAGEAILTFNHPIVDGEGFDFAVFENSFNDTFLELATVEVSSDGVHYFGFPTTSNTPTDKQVGGFGSVDATKLNNIAGKYRGGWGTPFDLSEIADNENLDKNNITHVKIRDVVGTINPQYATRDSHGNIINDPYPTPFESGGFDLSGVGVINNKTNTAQFDGIVGTEGCKAIEYKDSRFIDWAKTCVVTRGKADIAKPEKGLVSFGKEENAIGAVSSTDVYDCISLGDAGEAILTFNHPIVDGEGFDFAVFENSFNDTFLELATVEVSSDGVHYFGFPTTSNTPTDKQVGGFGSVDATKLNNIAGKYRGGWGTPFDLSEIADNENLDKNNITHVKIRDVVGTINPQYATRDSHGNIINDPYPTPFESGGFDLSGVGVINNKTNTAVPSAKSDVATLVYPNPCTDKVFVKANGRKVTVYNIMGQKLQEMTPAAQDLIQIDMSGYDKGVYIMELRNNNSVETLKIIKK